MNISKELLDELVAHALEDPGNEVCGVVAVEEADAGQPAPAEGEGHARAVRVLRATNIHASPLKFEIDPKELLALYLGIEAEGQALGAIYHSHVRSRPYPSQTDINFAASWPGVEWIIVGLVAGAEPEVRSYLIEDGAVREVPLEVR
jgi:[CysO sulfur-carrier protein]-S-L-cysteine hydrolase